MIYFDNNATTQPLPEVTEAVARCMGEAYANPSSAHQFGQRARHQVECAREQVARLIGASAKEIIFTSGGTESINTALHGMFAGESTRRRVVTTTVEHPAVLRVCERLDARGHAVDYVGVDGDGQMDRAQWQRTVTPETAVASFQHANNETGVVQDVAALAAIAAERGVIVHVDAVQAAGKTPIDVHSWSVNLLSISAHKFHGPKGVGALYVRRRTRLDPLMVGGTQERQLRGGTENVAGIVGMGVAAEIAASRLSETIGDVAGLRDAFESGVQAAVPFAHVNGRSAPRVCNTSNVSFAELEAEAILLLLSEAGVCASSGAACSSGSLEPSHVLRAMGVEQRLAHGAVRFSFSRLNTQAEVERVVALLPGLLGRLTALRRR